MTDTGWKWFCPECGNIENGERPPKDCSMCGNLGDNFYQTPD